MAITLIEGVGGSGGSPPSAAVFTNSIPSGDLIVACVELAGNPNFPSAPNAASVVVSDNVNTGNYTNLGFYFDATNWVSIYWKIANATGTPSLTCTMNNATFGFIDAGHFNGFAGTPTADASLDVTGTATTGTAFSISPIVTNFNNELLLISDYLGGAGFTAPPAGWTAIHVGARSWYAVETSSGTTNNASATITASTAWTGLALGIYDSVVSGAKLAWLV